MSSSTAVAAASTIYLGLDVHKDSITIAVLPNGPRRRPGSSDCPTTGPGSSASSIAAHASEAEERVRDVVRCRETFQREILKSRHYILKFLARRGFVFRDGTNWCTPHRR